MRYKYTLILTIIGAALCLIHYIGHEYDPIYLLFYSLSVPAWFYPIFTYTDVNPCFSIFSRLCRGPSWVTSLTASRFTANPAVNRPSRHRLSMLETWPGLLVMAAIFFLHY